MTTLVKFNEAYQALMVAKTIDEVKDIIDQATALKAIYKQAGDCLEMQNACAEMIIRGKVRGADIADEMQASGQLEKSGGDRKSLSNGRTMKFKDVGIDRRRLNDWRKIKAVPKDAREKFIAETKAAQKELTTAGVLSLGQQLKRQQQKQNGHDSIIDLQKQLPPTDNENCLYQDDLTRIWQGDASDLWFIEDDTIDLIVTSPPYNIGLKNGTGRMLWHGVKYSTSDDKMPEEEYQEWQIKVLDELWRVIRPGGSLFYNHKIRNRNGQGIHPMAWIARSKWNFRQQITWDRGSTHNKEMSYFWPHDELIFWLTKGTEGIYLSPEGARMSTVWRFNFETNNDHPAPFPKILPAMCIRAASREGDLVLDPFGGSMTTCRAARELKRRSIGVDISKEYVTKYSHQFYQGILL